MPKFVLTAELAVRNQNLRPVISQLQKQLSSVKANVTLNLDPSTKGKLDNINKSLAVTETRLKSAAGAAVVLNQQISQLNKTLGGNLKQLGQITKTAQANQKAMQATSKAVNQSASAMTKLGQQSAFAIKRIAAFSVATSGVIALTTALKSGIQEAILFQHGLVRVSQITGTSVKNLGNLTAEITRLATTLGVSSQELLAVSDTLAQAGLSANEVTVALEALAKTKLAPTFGKIEDTVEGVIASMRQFKIEVNDLEATLGSFNSVAAAFAVESDDIVTAVRRSGAAFEAAGGNLNEFIALFTSVRQTTRESAETIATGFRTIFTRLQRPKTLDFLRDIGVELIDLQGRFVGPYEAVRRLNEALASIPGNDPRFAQIVEELGGFRQVSKVIPLIQQFATAEKALAVAQRGRGSLTRDAVTAQQSLLVQLTQLRERFFELFRTIGDNTAIKGFLQFTLKIADSLITVGQSLTPLVPLFTALGAIKLGAGLKNFNLGFFGGKANSGTVTGANTNNKLNAANTAASTQASSQSSAVSANTQALNNLASQINNLSSALKASTAASFKTVVGPGGIQRQVPRRFARGGLVPGRGNRDTVPALLTPGEYVLPTHVVESMGAENVAKFANAGKVHAKDSIKAALTREKNQQAFGLIGLFPEQDAVSPELRTIPGADIQKYLQKNVYSNIGDNVKAPKQAAFPYTLYSGTVSNSFGNEFETHLKKRLTTIAEASGKQIASILGSNSFRAINIDLFNFEQMSGNIYEAALSSLGTPYVDKTGSTDPFDFLGGVTPELAQRVFKSPELASIPTDVKRTISADTKSSIDDKITQVIADNIRFDNISTKLNPINISELTAIANGTTKQNKGEQERTLRRLRQSVGYSGIRKKDSLAAQAQELVDLHQTTPVQRNAGGSINGVGTDTVPALLTPGEYVLDKATAQRVGYANLDRMRVQKFAKGGYVKRFASGGKATASGGGFDTTKLTPLLFVLPSLAQQFGGLSDELGQTITQVITLATVAGATGKSFFGLKENTERVNKAQSKLASQAAPTNRSFKRLEASHLQFQSSGSQEDFAAFKRQTQRTYQNTQRRQKLRQTQLRQAKIDRAAEVGGGTIAGLGILASGIGSSFSSSANKNIQAGKGTQQDIKNAGIGGALSGFGTGAVTGAAIGSFLGPLGTLGGAVIGGAIGAFAEFSAATEQATAQMKSVQIAADFERLGKTLDRINKNKTLSGSDRAAGINEVNKIQSNILSTSGEGRQEAVAKAQGQLPALEAFGDKMAQASKSIEEFEAKAPGFINTLSLVAEIPIDEVRASYDKQIKAQQNAVKLQQQVNAALAQIYQDTEYVSNLVRAFNDSTNTLQKVTNKANIIANDFQNLQFDVNLGEIIGQGLDANPVDLEKVLTQLLGNSGNNLASRLVTTVKASSALPEALRSAVAGGALTDVDPTSQMTGYLDSVFASLKSQLGPLPAEFRQELEANLSDFIGDDSGPQKFKAAVEANAEEFAKKLSEGTSKYFESLKQAADIAKENANQLIGIIQQRNTIEQKVLSLRNTAATSQFKLLRQFKLVGTERFNSDLTSSEAGTLFTQQQAIRLSNVRGVNGNSSSGDLARQIELRRANLLSLQDARNKVSPVGDTASEFEVLSQQIGKTESELTSLMGALEEQANSTERLTALQTELGAAENKRKSQLALLSNLSFAGREGRQEFVRSALSARAVAKNPKIIGSSEQEGSALRFLDQIIEAGSGDKQLGILGNKTAKQVKEERLAAFTGDKELAKALTNGTPEEVKIQNDILKAQSAMLKAQQDLAKLEDTKLTNINTTLEAGFMDMQNAFLQGMAEAESRKSEAKARTATDAAIKATEQLTGRQQLNQSLQSIGIRPDEAEKLNNLSPQLDLIEKQRNIRKKLDTIKENGIGITKTGSKKEVIDSLRTAFSGTIDEPTLLKEAESIFAKLSAGKITQLENGRFVSQKFSPEESSAFLSVEAKKLASRYSTNNQRFEEQDMQKKFFEQGFGPNIIDALLARPDIRKQLSKYSDVNLETAQKDFNKTAKDEALAKKQAQEDKAKVATLKTAEQTATQNRNERIAQQQASTLGNIDGSTKSSDFTLYDIYKAVLDLTTVTESQEAPVVNVNIPKQEQQKGNTTKVNVAAAKIPAFKFPEFKLPKFPSVSDFFKGDIIPPGTFGTSTPTALGAGNNGPKPKFGRFGQSPAQRQKVEDANNERQRKLDELEDGRQKWKDILKQREIEKIDRDKDLQDQVKNPIGIGRPELPKPGVNTPKPIVPNIPNPDIVDIYKNTRPYNHFPIDSLTPIPKPRIESPNYTERPRVSINSLMPKSIGAGKRAYNDYLQGLKLENNKLFPQLEDSFKTFNQDLLKTVDELGQVCKILPTSIDLNGRFEPIQVNITGGEIFKLLGEPIAALVMDRVAGQIAKVIPGFKTIIGPGQQQNDKPIA